jgi:hypothetical protein
VLGQAGDERGPDVVAPGSMIVRMMPNGAISWATASQEPSMPRSPG